MTLFGRTFGPEEIASLVAMLMVLAVWVGALSGQRRWSAGIKAWEARRKQRREAEAVSMASAVDRSNTFLTAAMSGSISEVAKPQAKNRVVT